MFFADNTVVQLSTAQGYIGIAVFLFGLGVAWTTLKMSVKHASDTLTKLESDMTNVIKPDLKDVRERFATLEGKTANMFASHSPIGLTEGGEKFLEASGLKKYIDDNVDLLTSACSEDRKLKTPYDVQEAVFSFFDEYNFPEDIENEVKTYAFKQGLSFDVARRIGAIYFRNICLSNLGFTPEDLDGPKSQS